MNSASFVNKNLSPNNLHGLKNLFFFFFFCHNIHRGHSKIVKLLLKHNANCDIQDAEGNTALYVSCFTAPLLPWNYGQVADGSTRQHQLADV